MSDFGILEWFDVLGADGKTLYTVGTLVNFSGILPVAIEILI